MNDGGAAFPRLLPNVTVPPDDAADIARRYRGMSLRDYFAGQALVGMLSSDMDMDGDRMTLAAYVYADAMLKAKGDHP